MAERKVATTVRGRLVERYVRLGPGRTRLKGMPILGGGMKRPSGHAPRDPDRR
jgi:hypothetical protein